MWLFVCVFGMSLMWFFSVDWSLVSLLMVCAFVVAAICLFARFVWLFGYACVCLFVCVCVVVS